MGNNISKEDFARSVLDGKYDQDFTKLSQSNPQLRSQFEPVMARIKIQAGEYVTSLPSVPPIPSPITPPPVPPPPAPPPPASASLTSEPTPTPALTTPSTPPVLPASPTQAFSMPQLPSKNVVKAFVDEVASKKGTPAVIDISEITTLLESTVSDDKQLVHFLRSLAEDGVISDRHEAAALVLVGRNLPSLKEDKDYATIEPPEVRAIFVEKRHNDDLGSRPLSSLCLQICTYLENVKSNPHKKDAIKKLQRETIKITTVQEPVDFIKEGYANGTLTEAERDILNTLFLDIEKFNTDFEQAKTENKNYEQDFLEGLQSLIDKLSQGTEGLDIKIYHYFDKNTIALSRHCKQNESAMPKLAQSIESLGEWINVRNSSLLAAYLHKKGFASKFSGTSTVISSEGDTDRKQIAQLPLLRTILAERFSTNTGASGSRVLNAYIELLNKGQLPTKETLMKTGRLGNEQDYNDGLSTIQKVLGESAVLLIFPQKSSDKIYTAYIKHRAENSDAKFGFDVLCASLSKKTVQEKKALASKIILRESPSVGDIDLEFAEALNQIQSEASAYHDKIEKEERELAELKQKRLAVKEWNPERIDIELVQGNLKLYLSSKLEPQDFLQSFDDYYNSTLKIVTDVYSDQDNEVIKTRGQKLLAALNITETNLQVAWCYGKVRGSSEEANLEEILTEAKKIVTQPPEETNYKFILEGLIHLEGFCETRFPTSLDASIKDKVRNGLMFASHSQDYSSFLGTNLSDFSYLGIDKHLFEILVERVTDVTETEYRLYKACKKLAFDNNGTKTVRKRDLLAALLLNETDDKNGSEEVEEVKELKQLIQSSSEISFGLTGETFCFKGENGTTDPRTLPVTTPMKGRMGRANGYWHPRLQSPITITVKK